MDPLKRKIHEEKQKFRQLNPLRCARKMWTGMDGSNNPNVPGQDNGHNAWMDVQLNEVDKDLQYEVTYAKKNSDNNKFFDIDDIPIHGPRHHYDDIPSDVSVDGATEKVKKRIEGDDLYICRNSGTMRRKQQERELQKCTEKHRRPSSTVTRAEYYDNNSRTMYARNDDRHNRYENNNREYRYSQQQNEWDIDKESIISNNADDGQKDIIEIDRDKVETDITKNVNYEDYTTDYRGSRYEYPKRTDRGYRGDRGPSYGRRGRKYEYNTDTRKRAIQQQ